MTLAHVCKSSNVHNTPGKHNFVLVH